MAKDSGKVDIHGKEYITVAYRVGEFRKKHALDLSIETEIVSTDEERVVMKAMIKNKEDFVIATGYAEEMRGSTMINKTSALENCETSAIGRALAAFGLAGTEYASADEVANAISNQNNKPTNPAKQPVGTAAKPFRATKKQLETMFSLAKENGQATQEAALAWLIEKGDKDPREMDVSQASALIDELIGNKSNG